MKMVYRVIKVFVLMMMAGFALSLLSLHHKGPPARVAPLGRSLSVKAPQKLAPVLPQQGIVISGVGRKEPSARQFEDEEEKKTIPPDDAAADDSEAHLGAGLLQHEAGNEEEAIKELQEALRLDPHNVDAKYNLAKILTFDLGEELDPSELKRAERYYLEIQDESPDQYDIQNGLASLYDLTDRTEEAVWIWENMARQNVADSDIYTNLSNAYLGMDQYEDAIASARKALEADPEDADAYFLMGLAERNLGNKDSSSEAIRKATELDPSNPVYLQNMEGPHPK